MRPSRDLGAIAAEAHRGRKLFSYLFFDASFAQPLIQLGCADPERQRDDILDLLP